eukprot:TRINITY_DN859_c0_g1_i1.p1 TRINITY_DN859_c0_g1~~TRINITY_DN859_c0_g1_i1.p1  ORF type:complete len:171 (-),score=24.15 TRINITY_DN859_c0_g1_i1:62-574(-)
MTLSRYNNIFENGYVILSKRGFWRLKNTQENTYYRQTAKPAYSTESVSTSPVFSNIQTYDHQKSTTHNPTNHTNKNAFQLYQPQSPQKNMLLDKFVAMGPSNMSSLNPRNAIMGSGIVPSKLGLNDQLSSLLRSKSGVVHPNRSPKKSLVKTRHNTRLIPGIKDLIEQFC